METNQELFREETEERDFGRQVISWSGFPIHLLLSVGEPDFYKQIIDFPSGKVSKLVAETCLKNPQFKLAIDSQGFGLYIDYIEYCQCHHDLSCWYWQ